MTSFRIKTSKDLDYMRESGRMLATILNKLEKVAAPGMTPKDLSAMAKEELKKLGGEPAFLGYHGFPDVICISVNDQVQHSIPNSVDLEEGDVVNFDFGVKYNGMITDAGTTVIIGGRALTKRDDELIRGTLEARSAAVNIIKSGIKVGDISATVQKVLDSYKLGIVKELVGHGVGYELHEDPEIPNYGKAGTGPVLQEGMTIAVEPITTSGSPDIFIEKDGWTIRTWDGSNSAQFEHTILVLNGGSEVLTKI
jgi:methionyl aminopeptidase